MEHIAKIQYGNHQAKINLARGGNCISLRMGDARILREPLKEPLDNPYLYGMPILFPVNRISGGSFTFEGRTYAFPVNEPATGCHLHGLLHETPFELVDAQKDSITCAYTADDANAYLQFPHAFRIEMTYRLSDDGFSHEVRIENLSEQNMPVMIGFHTTFRTCFLNGTPEETFVYAGLEKEIERNMQTYLPTGALPEFDKVSTAITSGTFRPLGQLVSHHFKATPGGMMVIYDRLNNKSMVYENDAKYAFRLIYAQEDYICLEPQNCMANCANAPFDRSETGFDFIAPKAAKTYRSRIRVADGDMCP